VRLSLSKIKSRAARRCALALLAPPAFVAVITLWALVGAFKFYIHFRAAWR
jgi:hypothetical protein